MNFSKSVFECSKHWEFALFCDLNENGFWIKLIMQSLLELKRALLFFSEYCSNG